MRRFHVVLLVAVMVGSTICGGCGARDPLAGKPFATLELAPITPDAKPIAAADLQGKVTLVNFWATWCPPCIQEFPHLLRVVEGYRNNEDFQFVSVATGFETVGEIQSESTAFLKDRGYRIPVYADIQGRTQRSLPGASNAIPVTVLVGRDGMIVKSVVGYNSAELDEMQLQIASLLQATK